MHKRVNRQAERGVAVLGAVLMTALLLSIASFAALSIALSGSRRAKAFDESSVRAQYAAQAGLVRAYEELWRTPAYCGETWSIDTDGSGTLPVTSVAIAVTSCGAGNAHTVSAKATY